MRISEDANAGGEILRMRTPDGGRDLLPGVLRRRLLLPESGVEIALLDWGGEGPLALLHHANGFCAALWAPIAERLRDRFHVVAMDARGHGDSTLPSEGVSAPAFAWPILRDDLLAVAAALLEETGEPRIALGLGHSLGGTLTLCAAGTRANLFERLLLVDPVILPAMTKQASAARTSEVGLAERARRRRHSWPTRQEARAYLAERDLFRAWRARSLDLYVAEALRERADGQVELKCAGAVEAQIFSGTHTLDVTSPARRVKNPVHILWAAGGNFPRSAYESLVADMSCATIEDAQVGHLVPMEQPEIVLDAVDRLCAEAQPTSR